jgi:hypothetical protein
VERTPSAALQISFLTKSRRPVSERHVYTAAFNRLIGETLGDLPAEIIAAAGGGPGLKQDAARFRAGSAGPTMGLHRWRFVTPWTPAPTRHGLRPLPGQAELEVRKKRKENALGIFIEF